MNILHVLAKKTEKGVGGDLESTQLLYGEKNITYWIILELLFLAFSIFVSTKTRARVLFFDIFLKI